VKIKVEQLDTIYCKTGMLKIYLDIILFMLCCTLQRNATAICNSHKQSVNYRSL